jgi:hypothetical protein
MWRLRHDDPERGVIAPLTAILMVAMLGMAAFAVDVATMYSEHAQLQNGADSAALAIADSCAKTPTAASCTAPMSFATGFANGNALDGHTNVLSATVTSDASSGRVNVTTQSQDTSGNNHFSLVFARVLGIQVTDIQASAEAKWKYPTKGRTVLPLAFATCEFIDDGLPHKILIQGGAQDCNGRNPSNQIIPGGFAWLAPDGNTGCNVTAEVGQWSLTSAGGSVPTGCMDLFDPSKNPDLANSIVAIPVYKYTCSGMSTSQFGSCNGSTVQYFIEKWAGFKLQAWNLSGQAKYNAGVFSGSEKGLYGTFVGYSADPGLFTGGSTTQNGNVIVVGLTK